MQYSAQHITDFQEMVWDYYHRAGRTALPWRQPEPDGTFDPYKIMVSELMLQQTQVARVIPKFETFTSAFPTVGVLAEASLGDVLRLWQGLGYNRRAKFLWQAAGAVVRRGEFPRRQQDLVKLPGVGANTAGAICAYAYNEPALFVETNIRTVYIHHFFDDREQVTDTDILEALRATMDYEHPREWYWALMDYGTFVKATHGNKSRASKTYVRQSKFAGSRRQVRGRVVRLLGERPWGIGELQETIADPRISEVLAELQTEGLIRMQGRKYTLD